MKNFKNLMPVFAAIMMMFTANSFAGTSNDQIAVNEIVRVYDGDTITVNIHKWPDIVGHEISIRVLGIDTPEIRGKCEKEKELAKLTRDYVYDVLVKAKKVHLENIERGKYFRILADVIVDGQNLSTLVIENSYALPYYGGTKDRMYWCDNF